MPKGKGVKQTKKGSLPKLHSPPNLRVSRYTRVIGVYPTKKMAIVSKAQVSRVIDKSQRTLKVSKAADGRHHVLRIKPLYEFIKGG